MPPATSRSAMPSSTYWAAVAIALMPDRQTLLTVRAGTVIGTPARVAAWRAVIWPWPAWSTWPMTTCRTASGEMPARWQRRERPAEAADRRAGTGADDRLRALEHAPNPPGCRSLIESTARPSRYPHAIVRLGFG